MTVVLQDAAGDETFQWYEGNAGDTSSAVNGATSASLTPPAPGASTAFWVRISNGNGFTDSDTVSFTVNEPSNLAATHRLVDLGFTAGGTVTIETTFTYEGSSTAVGWSVTLPAGWSYAESGGDNVPPFPPQVGETGTISFAFVSIPASPISFTYTLNVPEGQTDPATIVGEVLFRDGVNPEQSVVITPSPLMVPPAPSLHSADTDGNNRLSLSELLRVIELYNTRFGTSRTGRYTTSGGTEDGFAPDNSVDGSTSVSLSRYHSADTDRDAKLSLSELLRVIELYNYRDGTTRTGEYHASASGEDGFATGPQPAI
jgi:hypothetical protein